MRATVTAAFQRGRVGEPIQSGVVPYRVVDQAIEVLLITSRSSGSWIFPKGMIEPELTALDSACKEAWEEAGVRGAAAPEPLGYYRHAKWGRTFDVSLYLLRVDSVGADWPECRVRRREWMPLDKAAAAVENPGLRDLIARVPAAVRRLRKGEPVMRVRVTFDYPKVPENRPVKVRALLKIDADSPRKESRRPLNIGVVLDRSGSMGGAKIHSVREATKALADKLGAEDVFSLTIFDNVIETIIPPRKMAEDLGALGNAVDGIEARNSTNLCGGYQAGCENVMRGRENGALDRVVLLTDGLANVGITDPAVIASISREMAERGLVTSTVGVGADYCESLLGRMAEAGGGNTYFLQSAVEVEAVLEEELGGLLSLAAEGLRVRFESRVEGLKATQLNTYRTAPDGAWILGDVYGSKTKTLVLALEIPPMPAGRKVRCGTLHLACKVTSEGGMTEFTEILPLDLDVVPEQEFAAQAIDTEVTLQAVEFIVAAAKIRAWESANRRDFDGAAKALNDCADELERIGVPHPAIAQHIANLRLEARRLGDELEAYYTPMRRKSMYYEGYYAANAKYSHLENMRSRHSGYASPVGCHTLPLLDVGGRFLTTVGTGRYLVDTGWPTSIGDGSLIIVGSRRCDARAKVGNSDAASISREIRAQVSGILGADILGQFDVGIDVGACLLMLDENRRPLPGKAVPVDYGSGLPVLPARIRGAAVSVVLGTGSRISLLRADLAAGGDPAGRELETIVGVGEYETEMRKVDIQLGDTTYGIRVGTLPPTLEAAFSATGLAGIVGADFLASRRICMSARQGVVTITNAGDPR